MLIDPAASDASLAAAQAGDDLRPFRQFISAFTGAMNDQTYAGQDGIAINYPNQGVVYTPGYGTAVEGKPIAITSAGGIVVSPTIVLIAIGAGIALLWKKG